MHFSLPANLDGKVTADGAWGGGLGLGLTEHLAASGNGIAALPHHAGNGAGAHVRDKAGEE